MNLVRAELQRLLARRFTQVLLLLVLAALTITFATTVVSSHQPTERELTLAQEQATQYRADREATYRQCLEITTRLGDAGQVGNRCGPPPSEIRTEDFLYGVFVFEREMPNLLYFLAAFLALFGFLVGASYVGAELTSGGMTNLLLWRPRRDVVLGTKLGVLLAGVTAVALTVIGLYVGAFWALAQTTGLPGDLSGRFWGGIVLQVLRTVALVGVVTALGFALATLGRHTAAALGAAATYVVVWEIGARIVMAAVDWRRTESYMLSSYIIAWMNGDYTAYEFACDGIDCAYTLSYTHATFVFAVLLAAVVGTAFVVFRKRDLA